MAPKTVFIIPYRDRLYHKEHFVIYMKYVLSNLDPNSYEIFFVHQLDTRPFNRGAMKNIGFIAIKERWPDNYKDITFIFNDIDTIPANENIMPYETSNGIVKHIYGFDFALGGIFLIKGIDFERIGGFPNFWGWGFEDKIIQARVLRHNIIIDRSNFYKIGDQRILHIFDGPMRALTKKDCWRLPDNSDSLNDISNLFYKFDGDEIKVSQFNTNIDPNTETFYTQNMKEDKVVHKDKNYKDNIVSLNMPAPASNTQNRHKKKWGIVI